MTIIYSAAQRLSSTSHRIQRISLSGIRKSHWYLTVTNPCISFNVRRKHMKQYLRAITIIIGSLILGFVCYLWSCKSDMWVAESRNAIITPPPPAWTVYTTPDYMFGSLLGPLMTVHPSLLAVGCILAGLFPSIIVVESIKSRRIVLGRYSWMLCMFILFWVVKLPMPGDWTLYYHLAVRY